MGSAADAVAAEAADAVAAVVQGAVGNQSAAQPPVEPGSADIGSIIMGSAAEAVAAAVFNQSVAGNQSAAEPGSTDMGSVIMGSAAEAVVAAVQGVQVEPEAADQSAVQPPGLEPGLPATEKQGALPPGPQTNKPARVFYMRWCADWGSGGRRSPHRQRRCRGVRGGDCVSP